MGVCGALNSAWREPHDQGGCIMEIVDAKVAELIENPHHVKASTLYDTKNAQDAYKTWRELKLRCDASAVEGFCGEALPGIVGNK